MVSSLAYLLSGIPRHSQATREAGRAPLDTEHLISLLNQASDNEQKQASDIHCSVMGAIFSHLPHLQEPPQLAPGNVPPTKPLFFGSPPIGSGGQPGGAVNEDTANQLFTAFKKFVEGGMPVNEAMEEAVLYADRKIHDYCKLRGLECTNFRELARDLPEIVDEWPLFKMLSDISNGIEHLEVDPTYF
ncbi:hypothetical protein NCLIV_016400 [Neospora caninum Liverpool]|uniref:Uncharacterized protein n=1 Tax=Neospora caninum (strain Liverpool) TaxID=572307 RepID=F0VDQ5_NEOCL|nr:hypothetical protein NCLIV_016400 [Neospora caninum Liverpool]CBZ51848.1 hypothetical protein NCLIV_016400 [Neospora caninum Liverpool]|eukprot:XP_003881881.1 hypothetical protein NCLIV_016400 [Neospora caninum Liverpool]